MTLTAVEVLDEPCPVCGIRGWLWICAATQRCGCQACGHCVAIVIDPGEGVIADG